MDTWSATTSSALNSGGDDHSDGEVSRYPELTFTRVPDIPAYAIGGHELYYVDTGTGTVRVGDVSTAGKLEFHPRQRAARSFQ